MTKDFRLTPLLKKIKNIKLYELSGRTGVRVIYFNQLSNEEIWLLLIYSKSARENIPAHVLRAIRDEIKDASE